MAYRLLSAPILLLVWTLLQDRTAAQAEKNAFNLKSAQGNLVELTANNCSRFYYRFAYSNYQIALSLQEDLPKGCYLYRDIKILTNGGSYFTPYCPTSVIGAEYQGPNKYVNETIYFRIYRRHLSRYLPDSPNRRVFTLYSACSSDFDARLSVELLASSGTRSKSSSKKKIDSTVTFIVIGVACVLGIIIRLLFRLGHCRRSTSETAATSSENPVELTSTVSRQDPPNSTEASGDSHDNAQDPLSDKKALLDL